MLIDERVRVAGGGMQAVAEAGKHGRAIDARNHATLHVLMPDVALGVIGHVEHRAALRRQGVDSARPSAAILRCASVRFRPWLLLGLVGRQ